MKQLRYCLALLGAGLSSVLAGHAQGVGIGTAGPPDASAGLELSSTSQGLLLPRLTAAQRAAIANPAPGLLVYQTDGTLGLYYYSGVAWVNVSDGRVPNDAGSTVPTNSGLVTTLAGSASTVGGVVSSGSADGTGSAARFSGPYGVAVGPGGTLYVADTGNSSVRKITQAGVVTTLAGPGAGLVAPSGVAVDANGTVYLAEYADHTILKITPSGVVSTLAGSAGTSGSADGTGTAATFRNPMGVAVDAAGTVYVADSGNGNLRKISPAGVVTTLVGGASLGYLVGVAVDAIGTLYVASLSSSAIYKISPAGAVTVLAGSPNSPSGSSNGTGAGARFNFPYGVAVDGGGTVYVGDQCNQTIRRITAAGVVTTLAGTAGTAGSADGTGPVARFNYPTGVAVDAAGMVYVADQRNNTIRAIR